MILIKNKPQKVKLTNFLGWQENSVGYLCDSCRMGEDVVAPQRDVWDLLQWDIGCFCSSKSGVVLNMIKSWVMEGRPNGIVLVLSPQDEKKARLVH